MNLKELTRQWATLSKQSNKVQLPNYFIDTDDNVSPNRLADVLSTKLKEYDLVESTRADKPFVYFLSKPGEHEDDFPSLTNFYEEYKHNLSKFNVPYKGVMLIDLSDWDDLKGYEKKLDAFLTFIDSIQDGIVFIFISKNDLNINNRLYKAISNKLWIERASEHSNVKDCAKEYFYALVKRSGLSVPNEIDTTLQRTINEFFANNESLENFKKFSQQIVYTKLKSGLNGVKTIEIKDIKKFKGYANKKAEPFRLF